VVDRCAPCCWARKLNDLCLFKLLPATFLILFGIAGTILILRHFGWLHQKAEFNLFFQFDFCKVFPCFTSLVVIAFPSCTEPMTGVGWKQEPHDDTGVGWKQEPTHHAEQIASKGESVSGLMGLDRLNGWNFCWCWELDLFSAAERFLQVSLGGVVFYPSTVLQWNRLTKPEQVQIQLLQF